MKYKVNLLSLFRNTSIILWLPLILVEAWLAFTLVIFKFGPWDYSIKRPDLFWIYMGLYCIMFAIGFIVLIASSKTKNTYKQSYDIETKVFKYLWIPFVVYFISFIPLYNMSTGGTAFAFFQNLILGVTDPSAAYYAKINTNISNSQPAILQVLILGVIAPILWLIIPLSVYFWTKMKWYYKVAFSLYLFLELGKWISVGTNKGIFDLLVVILVTLTVDVCINFKNDKLKTLKKKFSLVVIVFLAFILFVGYFGLSMTSRVGLVRNQTEDKNVAMAGLTLKKDDPALVSQKGSEQTASSEQTAPPKQTETDNKPKSRINTLIDNTYLGLTAYLTQGYYAMGEALTKDFTSTYGIGNSFFLIRVDEVLTGQNIINNTYPGKLLPAIDPYIRWHTAFTWWASDLSFPGVAVFMAILGAAFAWFWIDAVERKNVISYSLLSLFGIMFFYITCNNQVFAFVQTFCAFWGLVLIRFLYYFINTKMNRKPATEVNAK